MYDFIVFFNKWIFTKKCAVHLPPPTHRGRRKEVVSSCIFIGGGLRPPYHTRMNYYINRGAPPLIFINIRVARVARD